MADELAVFEFSTLLALGLCKDDEIRRVADFTALVVTMDLKPHVCSLIQLELTGCSRDKRDDLDRAGRIRHSEGTCDRFDVRTIQFLYNVGLGNWWADRRRADTALGFHLERIGIVCLDVAVAIHGRNDNLEVFTDLVVGPVDESDAAIRRNVEVVWLR